MPQPDNKRERGKATQLPGQTVAPEGVSGIVGADGAAIGAAISKIQDSAPTQIQIGQQARIVDDGSKLFNIMQGAATGAQQGIENYQKMYQYVSEKNYAEFETEMAEQQRLTGGDARKMAEWAKAHTYRPNDVTAKKYNIAMAQIEGKEADVLENEKLNYDLNMLSKMSDADALDETNRLLKHADPDSRYYATLAKERNRLNGNVAGTARQIQNIMYKSDIQTTGFELGEQLTRSGISAYDLSTPAANNVARMYQLMGGGQNNDRIQIMADGTIQYMDNQNTVHQGHFQGGIGKELADAIERDLGEFAGPLDNPAAIDTTRFDELATVMQYGGFSRTHTSTRKAAPPKVGVVDPAAMVQTAARGATPDVLAAVVRQTVPTADNLATDTSDGREKARAGYIELYKKSLAAITANEDMTIHEKNAAYDSLLLGLSGDVPVWQDYGFASDADYDSAVGELRKNITKERTASVVAGVGEHAARVAHENSTETSISNYRTRTNGLILQTASAASGIDGTMDIGVVGEDGSLIQSYSSFSQLQDALRENPTMFDNGWAIRLDPESMPAGTLGRAQAIDDNNPLIFIGSDGQAPPSDSMQAMAAHRKAARDLKNIERVVSLLDSPSDEDVPLPADIVDAGTAILERFDPNNPVNAMMLATIVANPKVPAGARATLAKRMMATDREAVLAAMRPEELSVAMLRDRSAMGEEDAAKVQTLEVLFGRSETRDLALQIVEGEGGSTQQTSRLAWELTEGRAFMQMFEQIDPTGANTEALMSRAYGASNSPAMAAMVDSDYLAPAYNLIRATDDTIDDAQTAFEGSIVLSAFDAQWQRVNGDSQTLMQSLRDPETSATALTWLQKNTSLAKTREVWATQLGGASATATAATLTPKEGLTQGGTANARAKYEAGAAMAEIAANMTTWNGNAAVVAPDIAAITTVNANGVRGSIAESVGRQLWQNVNARAQDNSNITDADGAATRGLLEVLGVDPTDYDLSPAQASEQIETWVSTGTSEGKFMLAVRDAMTEKIPTAWDSTQNDREPYGSTTTYYSGKIVLPEDTQLSDAAAMFTQFGAVTISRIPATNEQRLQSQNHENRDTVARTDDGRERGGGIFTVASGGKSDYNIDTNPLYYQKVKGELPKRALAATRAMP